MHEASVANGGAVKAARGTLASSSDAPHGIGLSEAEYRRIKQGLTFDRRYGVTLAIHAVDGALFALGAWLVLLDRTDAWLAAQLLFALVFWHAFALLHDCGHSSAAGNRALNTISGSWASLFCFMPFLPWKLIHQEHHLWTGHLERDPTARGLRRWKELRRIPLWIRMAWRTWIPATALFQHVVLWSYPVSIARSKGIRTSAFAYCTLSVLLLPATYASLHVLWPKLFCLHSFGGALLLYFALTELINLPHHSDMPFGFAKRLRPWEQWRTARSCSYPKWLAELMLLNFNLHVEHHLFPALPWYRLQAARALVRPALGRHYEEESGAAWSVRNRARDLEAVLFTTSVTPPS